VKAKRPHAFRLTPTEQALLELRREFPEMTMRDIIQQLGGGYDSGTIARAIDKERAYLLWEQQQRHTGQLSSTGQAHGSVRGNRKYIK